MSPNVSASEFLGKLHNNNHINADVSETILSTGFRAFKGFNTVTIGVRSSVGVNLPKDLFTFMKLGQTGPDTRYDFSDVQVNANAVAEIALGHSHKINKKLEVGAKVKFLLGLANVAARIDRMDIEMNQDHWSIDAIGSIEMAAGSGLYVPTKGETDPTCVPAERDLIDWENIDYDSFGLAGSGFGVDLGATYQLLPDLQLSASLNDLGFIHWNNAVKGETGAKPWSFDGFHDIYLGNDDNYQGNNKIEDQWDNIVDGLDELVNFHRVSDKSGYTKALHATLHIGAEYKMPFYKKLTGGFLFTSYFGGCMSFQEGRFFANVKPARWFDATINYGASTFGSSLGWMLNFHPRGFNFFIGSDHQFFKLTPQMVPVNNATASLNMGFNVTW